MIRCENCGWYNEDTSTHCEKCGEPIRTGRFCEKCKNNMATSLTDAFAKPIPVEVPKKKEHETDKMRFKR